MRVSEIVTWMELVDGSATAAAIDDAGLGRSRRRDDNVEEIAPADPRFAAIYLGWSSERAGLQSIAVHMHQPEPLRDDQIEARFGALDLEIPPLDAPEEPPQHATWFTSKRGRTLCIGIERDGTGRVKTVTLHAVHPDIVRARQSAADADS